MKKYERCMVFAGGGSRLGIYLGMFAAATDQGRMPDVILASCGGAIAAAIIHALPDDVQRKAWLCSPQMYQFWCGLKSARHATLLRTLGQVMRRKMTTAPAPFIPDLFRNYLFEAPSLLPLPPARQPAATAMAVIGGRLLYTALEAGQPRAQRKLFAQTVFCNEQAAGLIAGMPSPFIAPMWGAHAIDGAVQPVTTFAPEEAARMSISDFYYLPCHRHGEDYYIGGVIDLFPLEVAHRLAREVMMEFKQSFDQTLSIPAWRSVLGLDGNQRLRYVHGQHADVWVDTSDISQALHTQHIGKSLQWLHNRIGLVLPGSYATYVDYMEAQWQYGYRRAQEALRRTTPHDPSRMRQVNQYNQAFAGTPCVF